MVNRKICPIAEVLVFTNGYYLSIVLYTVTSRGQTPGVVNLSSVKCVKTTILFSKFGMVGLCFKHFLFPICAFSAVLRSKVFFYLFELSHETVYIL